MTTGRINQVSTRDTISRNTHLWSPHKHASHYHNTQTTCAAPCSHQLNALTHFHHYWLLTHMAVYTSRTYVQQPCRDFQTPFYIPFTTTQRIHKYADTNHTLSRAIHDFTIVCVHCKVVSRIRVVPCALTHTHTNHTNTLRQAVAVVFSPSSLTSHRVTSTNSHHSTSRAPGHEHCPASS